MFNVQIHPPITWYAFDCPRFFPGALPGTTLNATTRIYWSRSIKSDLTLETRMMYIVAQHPNGC